MFVKVSTFESELFSRRWAKEADARIRRRALPIFGREVRSIARKSIKASRLKDGRFQPSRPGNPPRYRTLGKNGNGVSKKTSRFVGSANFLFQFDRVSETVVVGPRKWRGGARPVPGLLEYGGVATYNPRQLSRYRERKIGDGGEIRVGGGFGGRDRKGRFLSSRSGMKVVRDTNVGDVWVAYGKLRTAKQVRRANEIQARLFLGATQRPPRSNRGTTRIAARPYTRPALAAFSKSDKPNNILTRTLANEARRAAASRLRRRFR